MSTRTLERAIESVPTSDGAGVKPRRRLGRADDLRDGTLAAGAR